MRCNLECNNYRLKCGLIKMQVIIARFIRDALSAIHELEVLIEKVIVWVENYNPELDIGDQKKYIEYAK